MAVKKVSKAKKGIRKKFYEVEVPMISARVSLYGASEEEFDGRAVKLDLTRSLRGRSFELRLKIKWDGKKLIGEPRSLGLIGSYIRRMMRKGVDYVEDSFIAECKDVKLRVKPFLITRNRVSRGVRNALRETARKYLEGHLKTRSSKELFEEIMANKLQKNLSVKLKKIYPLAFCEIRVFEIVGELERGEVEEESKVKKSKV